MLLTTALGWRSLCVALLWVSIGVVVSWGRRRGLALVVALLAALPTLVYALRLHPGMTFDRLALAEFDLVWHSALVPLVAALAGGLVAEAVSPSWREKRGHIATIRSARELAGKAREDAIQIGRELAEMRTARVTDPVALRTLEMSLSFVERRILDASRESASAHR